MKTDIKKEVRTQVIARRDAIGETARKDKNTTICNELLKIFNAEFDGKQTVISKKPTIAVYQSMKSEVDLTAFIHEVYVCGARIAFPCMTKIEGLSFSDWNKKSYMVFREVGKASFLALVNKSASTVPPPFLEKPLRSFTLDDPALEDFPLVNASEFDGVCVPLVAFDHSNNRLGYGGGNYDRFLKEVSTNARVVGVAFTEQEVEAVPLEGHDQVLPCIVTA